MNDSPFKGQPGEWIQRSLKKRHMRVETCLEKWPKSEFEFVRPQGYSNVQEQCVHCKTLKRFHA